jgi:outer membrane protein TolC
LLFRGGRATATDMVDAQAELTEARLQRLDAHVDLLVARTKLDHAIGKATRER